MHGSFLRNGYAFALIMANKVSIVKCDSYDNDLVYNSLKKALKDINFKFKPYSKVLIKPNVLGQYKPADGITTNYVIIDAICQILKENKCRIIIGESSGLYQNGGTKRAFSLSKIKEVSDKYNAELIAFESVNPKKVIDNNARILREIVLTNLAFEVDLIVNVPKLKTHSLMKYTGAVKNLFGLVPGGIKQNCHIIADNESKFGELLIDIYLNINTPKLNIMDGIIGLEGNGPGAGGSPIKTGYIMASENAVALDIAASSLIGYEPFEIMTNKIAVERGLLGKDDYEIIGEFTKLNYKKPSTITRRLPSFVKNLVINSLKFYPFTITDECKKCGACVKVCPASALTMKGYPVLDKNKCINCYCCHENCPYNAIELRKKSGIISNLVNLRNKI